MHNSHDTSYSSNSLSLRETTSNKKRCCCRVRDGLPGVQGPTGATGISPQGPQGVTGITGSIPAPTGAIAYAVNDQSLPNQTWYQVLLQAPTVSYNVNASPTGIAVLASGLYTICWALAVQPQYRIYSVVTIDGNQAGSAVVDRVPDIIGITSIGGSATQRISSGQTVSLFMFTQILVGNPSIVESATVGVYTINHLSYLSVARISD